MSVIKYPLSTEKAIRDREFNAKFAFIVDRKATKLDIKMALENDFGVHVAKVNTMITPEGKKKAYVQFASPDEVMDLATKLGLM